MVPVLIIVYDRESHQKRGGEMRKGEDEGRRTTKLIRRKQSGKSHRLIRVARPGSYLFSLYFPQFPF